MGVERRRTVRANDAQVLEAVIPAVAVDVVENQRDQTTVPELALSAQLTAPLLQALFVEPVLEMTAVERRVLNQHLRKRSSPSRSGTSLTCVWVEVRG